MTQGNAQYIVYIVLQSCACNMLMSARTPWCVAPISFMSCYAEAMASLQISCYQTTPDTKQQVYLLQQPV